MGPLFFILFINDISNIINNKTDVNLNLYAYDTALTIYASYNVTLTDRIQTYANKLALWFNNNNLKLNTEKTKILPYYNTV